MTDADLIALRDKAQHNFHRLESLVALLKSDLTALDAEVAARLSAGGTMVHPMEGGGNKPPA